MSQVILKQLQTVASIAALSGFCAVSLAPTPLLAQGKKPSRETAMQRCIVAAQTQYPDANTEQAGRVATYKACMTKAGYRP